MYATEQQLRARYGSDSVFYRTDDNGNIVASAAVIEAALQDASADIDAWSIHCQSKWSAQQLEAWTCDVAMYRLSIRQGAYTDEKKALNARVKDTILKACPPPSPADGGSANAGNLKPVVTSKPRRNSSGTNNW
jgi:phage gp36-like protein